jgi:predicted RNA-binding Zn ribbon-like protein
VKGTVDLELIAGHPALDFVNTVDDRLEPEPQDLLGSPAELAAWGELAGLLSGHLTGLDRPAARAELADAVALRDHLTALLDARADGRAAGKGHLEALARAVADAYAAGTLVDGDEGDGGLRWRWDPAALATVRHTVAVTANDLLGGPEAARIGRCPGPGCGWFFLDTTKRGNRRWCSMRECGQDAKSARRRAATRRE